MRTKHIVPGLAMALALVPSATAAKPAPKPPKPAPAPAGTGLTLDVKPVTIVFGSATTLSGQLNGAGSGGVKVNLEQDNTRPYGDKYVATGLTTTTANNGGYSFTNVKPLLNTQYRVTAQASPPITSAPKLVLVRTLVNFAVSDTTPKRGGFVRFYGTVFPEKDGRAALIQKRGSTGLFVTVATTPLLDAGTTKSKYSRTLRIRSNGVYRVKVAGDQMHVNGFSRTRSLTVHG